MRCGFRQMSGVRFDHKMLPGTTSCFIPHCLSKIEVTFPGNQAMIVVVGEGGGGARTGRKWARDTFNPVTIFHGTVNSHITK